MTRELYDRLAWFVNFARDNPKQASDFPMTITAEEVRQLVEAFPNPEAEYATGTAASLAKKLLGVHPNTGVRVTDGRAFQPLGHVFYDAELATIWLAPIDFELPSRVEL